MLSALLQTMRRLCYLTLLMGSFFLLTNSGTPAYAATGINKTINFQGRLYNAQGATVPDGYYNVQFKIYQDGDGQSAGNSTGSPAGTLKWTEDHLNAASQGVTVKNGFMSVELGSVTPFGTSIDWNQDTLWLSLNIGNTNVSCTPFASCSGDGEMLPMKRLSSVPYALNSAQLGGLTSAQFLQLAQGVQTDASTNTSSIFVNKTGTGGDFLQLQSSGTDVFTLSNTGNITLGSNADKTISVATAAASTAGSALTVSAGAGGSGTGSAGGNLVLQGGAAGGTDANGGNVTLNAGAKTGSGTDGTISIGTSNTSSIALGQDTTLAAGKSLTVTGGNTASRPASPTEGMIYFDSTTKQLLVYSNGKWQADRSAATKIVAANNSSQAAKDAADYVADGTGDQTEINNALTAAAGGRVYLAEGTYVANATILIPNNTTLAGAGQGTVVELADLDATDNLIENKDSTAGNATPGSGVRIQDMKLDGRKDLNTAGTQYGVYFSDMGSGTDTSAVAGASITGVTFTRFRNDGLYLTASSNNKISGNSFRLNGGAGLSVNALSNYNLISNNQSQGNTAEGIINSSSSQNTYSGNNIQGNGTIGISSLSGSSRNNFSGNTATDNPTAGIKFAGETRSTIVGNTIRGGGSNQYGIWITSSSSNNAISANNVYDTGGAGATNGIYVNIGSNNNITNNVVGDSSCNTTCYAVNIDHASSTNNYIASNNIDSGASIRDIGTGTILGGQVSTGGTFSIQNAASIGLSTSAQATTSDITISTGNASAGNSGSISLDVGTATGTKGTISIGTTNATSITIGSASTTTTIQGNTAVTLNGTTGTTQVCRNASGYLSSCDATFLAPTATNFIQNGTSQQASANFNISGTGTADTLQGTTKVMTALLDTATAATALNIGTTNANQINLNQNVVVAAGKSLTVTGGNTASRPASPTAGMLYYDTSTNQMLQYNGTKWVSTNEDSYLVAASDSSQTAKDAADYVADGTADNVEIQSALDRANPASAIGGARKSGKVYLFAGTYTIAANLSIYNNTTLSGAGTSTVLQLADLDAAASLITNNDTTSGTSIIIENMKLDGRNDLNTAGTQYGLYFDGLGGGTGATARAGVKVDSVTVTRFRTANIYLTASNYANFNKVTSQASGGSGAYLISSSNHNSFTGNTFYGNATNGMTINGSTYNAIAGNTFANNTADGLQLTNGSSYNSVTGNTSDTNGSDGYEITDGGTSGSSYNSLENNVAEGNTNAGINSNNSNSLSLVGNLIRNNATYGVYFNNSNFNTVGSNKISNSGGASNNNAIYLTNADSATITNNDITDSSATTTNYAINITNTATSSDNYLAANTYGSATINDQGTGTIYGGQVTSSGTFTIQNAASVQVGTSAGATSGNVTLSTGNASGGASGNISLDVGTASTTAGTISIGTVNASALTIGHAGTTTTIQGNTAVTLNGTTGTTQVCRNASGYLSSCDATFLAPTATNFIQNGTSQQASANFNISGTGTADTLQGTTKVMTALLDTATAATALNIGTTNANQINLNQNVVVAAGKSLTVTGGNTASRPASPTAGMLYYDTTTNQLIQYNGTKWVNNGSEAYLVAANDSSQQDKDAADFVADGTADDVEIQSALDRADPASVTSGARKSGKVYLFAGTYNIAASLSVKNNTVLAGSGRGTLLKFANITGTSVNMITNSDTGGTVSTGITIQDMQLDGNKSVNLTGTQNGIYLNKSGNGSGSTAKQGSKLLNLYIANFRTNNVQITNSSANNTISNVTSVTAAGAGFYLGGTGASNNNNTFTNNLAQGNGANGFTLDGASFNTLSGNTAEGNTGVGISLTSTSGTNNVTGNNARNNTSYGISVGSSTSNNISSNTASSNGASGIYIGASSYYTTVSSNNTSSNTGSGIMLDSAGRGSVTGNTSYSNTVNGINANNSGLTTISGNSIYSNPTGIYISGTSSDDGNITGNNISNSSSYGIQTLNMDRTTINNNRIVDSGGATDNNGIYLSSSTSNSITGNTITDGTPSGTNYAININNAASTGNYLAGNTIGTATINDAAISVATPTVYGGQNASSGAFTIQSASGVQVGTSAGTTSSNVTISTGNASAGASGNISLDVGTATTTAGTISIGTANTSAITIGRSGVTTTIQGNVGVTLNGTTGTTMVCQNGTGLLSSCDATYLAPTATNFIQNQNTAAQSTSNFWVSGTGKVDTAVLTPRLDTNTATALAIGDTNATSVTIGKAAGTAAVNVSSSTVNLGIATAATTMQAVGQTTANTQGSSLTMQGATGNGSGAGGSVTIQGGTGGATNAAGGNLYLTGGTAGGSSTSTGLVVINTPTFSTAAADANCYTSGSLVASSCSITAASVNGSGAIIVGFNTTGKTATLPDPTITTAGRVVYITAANLSEDFTLSVNGGGTGNTIAMRKNTTATMIWNGADWTAAGASSSTTLQSAYDNTLQSAGGAELVVSSTSNTKGLTIRDSSTSPVNGTLMSVQSSSAAGLFQVNSNVTEYATNAGSETGGAGGGLTDNTYPANTWTALTGTTISRYTTAGDYIATGQGSASATTTAVANTGLSNRLSTTLNANMTYNVSFTTRLTSGTFTDMNVYYSRDGTTTGGATCTAAATSVTSVWTKVNCTFTAPASGITSSNAIFIRQTAAAVRTFYVDNLSVTLAADLNYATDGTVNDDINFATNWSAVGTSTVSRNITDGQEASDSAQAAAGTTANNGLKNKLSVFPLTSTLYRVSVYAKLVSGTAFTDFKIRYTPDNGSTFVDCVDYNTQTVTTTDWTQVTCYIKTIGTTVTNPYMQFIQPTAPASARTYIVDTFSMSLTSASTPNVQIGGGSNGGPTTLFTLDRGASAPIAANNDALLGSMYYDTSLGKLQCYEADGWGACGSSPDNIITISPEYTNAVLHGTGIGTMTSDLCSDNLNVNDGSSSQPTICGTNETYNFYKWTSPQASSQTYSIYVTYQLPTTFKDFNSGQTSLMGRTDSTNSTVAYQVYRNSSTGLTACGSSIQVSNGVSSTWTTQTATGAADPSTCGFAGGDSIVFKIDVTAKSNANAYVGNLNFAFSNR